MLHVRIIAVGNLKEKYFTQALAEYTKRLTKYCKLEIKEIRESNIKQECNDIRPLVKGHVFLCDLNGELFTSQALSSKIGNLTQTTSTITFIIGGSDGVGSNLDDIINTRLSFGRITMPHQMFRVVLAEQIYRAFTILKNEKYHK